MKDKTKEMKTGAIIGHWKGSATIPAASELNYTSKFIEVTIQPASLFKVLTILYNESVLLEKVVPRIVGLSKIVSNK